MGEELPSKCWLHHRDGSAEIFEGDAVERALEEGWRRHPNDFKDQGETDAPVAANTTEAADKVPEPPAPPEGEVLPTPDNPPPGGEPQTEGRPTTDEPPYPVAGESG